MVNQTACAFSNTTSTKYKSLGCIGEGASSQVHLGYEVHSKDKVALKFLNRESLSTESSVRLEREIAILKKIAALPSTHNEDDLLRLREVVTSGDTTCIVTDFVEGGELHDYCDEYVNGVPERIGKWVFKKVLKSVERIHDNDICHLDLKLENVMYNKETHQVKLIDFGFAAETAEVDTEGNKKEKLQTDFCGSVHYAAPEIVKRTPFNGKKADVWSLGVLLFVLLSGLFPFDDSQGRIEFIFDQIVASTFFVPSYLSTDAQSLLQMMLQHDPKQRPTVSEVLKHPWFGVGY